MYAVMFNRNLCRRQRSQQRAFFFGCLVFLIVFLRTEFAASAEKPALVVVVSVDQLSYEYLERFADNFKPDGLVRQTRDSGAWYSNCKHQHAFTYTGPGHAVLMTGAYPNRHGIIDNNWFDRDLGKLVYCVSDANARLIGAETADDPVSPRRLLSDTVGDQLKLASPKSKVFTVAIKDRAAILLAGRLADAAIWMSNEGPWITSSHYGSSLPEAIDEINQQKSFKQYANRIWSPLLDRKQYKHGVEENSFGEKPLYEITTDFPHAMKAADDKNYIKTLACSPFGNEWTLSAARALVTSENLGQDDHPDILGINLSSNDYVGHSFGPQSLEVEDMTYRTDLQLGKFVRFLKKKLAGRRFVMFVTADHGVAPIPELAAKLGLVAARNPMGKATGGTGNIAEMRDALNDYLLESQQLNLPEGKLPVQAFVANGVYLNKALLGMKFNRVCRATRDWCLQHPAIVEAMPREDLLGDVNSSSALHRYLRQSFHAKRSPDVLFVLRPYHFTSTAPTTHGSPWHYDRHVPMLVVGDVKNSFTASEVSPASIATTIARLLKIEYPSTAAANPLEEIVGKIH